MASLTALSTPGVYVQEVPGFPPSVAQVPTAIPAFIGYTQMATNNGQNLTLIPTLISSLLDYNAYFGAEYDLGSSDVTVQVNMSVPSIPVTSITITKIFYMYEALRHFFDNGGGQCYIVSVGSYSGAISAGDETTTPPTGLRAGVAAVAKYNDPTLLLFPDAVRLPAADFYSLQQMALLQCATLQDRFAVLDLQEPTVSAQPAAPQTFRNAIGINNLEYSAAYTPWLYSAYSKTVTYAMLYNSGTNVSNIQDSSSANAAVPLTNLSTDPKMIALVTTMVIANADLSAINAVVSTLAGSAGSLSAAYGTLRGAVMATPTSANMNALMTFVHNVAIAPLTWAGTGANSFNATGSLHNDLVNNASNQSTGLYKYIPLLVQLQENTGLLSNGVTGNDYSGYNGSTWISQPISYTPAAPFTGTLQAIIYAALNVLDPIMTALFNFVATLQNAAAAYTNIAQSQLFNTHPVISNIVAQLSAELSRTPPSGAMVGVYANVDSNVGPWQAPANVSLNSISGPSAIIDATTQGGLNVDPIAGKSINAIRSFTGRGTIVWGARTLDGNDDNWRYISVRRLFIMVEQSVKDACQVFVFSPNDASTWAKVKSMISNYMNNLWREQAIVGSKPELSYYVNVGLGETMNQDDINNGRMIVQIGMAPVRPAEFIVLVFTQIQQQ